jgi:UDP-N-acetyl-D-galactosamine dehydrogenase
MAQKRINVGESRILILGLTFKENCPDIRNTRVIDIVRTLRDYNASVDVHDPWAGKEEVRAEYGLELVENPPKDYYDAVVLAVAHKAFRDMSSPSVREFAKPGGVVFDVKHVLPAAMVDECL